MLDINNAQDRITMINLLKDVKSKLLIITVEEDNLIQTLKSRIKQIKNRHKYDAAEKYVNALKQRQ